MIVAQVICVVVGISIVLSVLISALETVVLPMRGFTRIARFERFDGRVGDYVPKNCPEQIAECIFRALDAGKSQPCSAS